MSDFVAVGSEEALTSDDPVLRILARGTLSGWVEQFQAWVQDEGRRTRSKEHEADLLIAVTRLMVMTHSSVVANFMDEGGFQVMATTMKRCIDTEYVPHATMCRAIVQEKRVSR